MRSRSMLAISAAVIRSCAAGANAAKAEVRLSVARAAAEAQKVRRLITNALLFPSAMILLPGRSMKIIFYL